MKKIIYFVPAVLAVLFYLLVGFTASFGGISPWVWFGIALMFASAIVMFRGKWYGCTGGLAVGIFVFYLGTQYSGQTVDIERPLGVILCIYYAICGIAVYKKWF